MTVKKKTAAQAATEAAESEKAEKAGNNTSEAGKAENGENTAAETEGEKRGKTKLIYIGPTLPRAKLKTNRIFTGTHEEIKKELAPAVEKYPLVERLMVPLDGLAEKKDKVKTTGNILNKYYSDLASLFAAEMQKEG